MNEQSYKDIINFAIKVSLILSILFTALGTIKSFASANEYSDYNNDDNFKYRFKQLYVSGFGSVISFSGILQKNSNYLKYKKGCFKNEGLPLYDSLGNPIQNLVDNGDIPALCNVVYEYDHMGVPTDYSLVSEKMKLDLEGGSMWGFALGLNTHSAFRTEIAYNLLFKSLKKDKSIKGHGSAISVLDKNDYHIDFKSRSLFINTYFDVLLDRRDSPIFVPYIMVGGGITDNRISVEYLPNITNPLSTITIPEVKNFKAAFTTGIGFSSSVSNYIILDISARYYNFGKMNTEKYYIQNNTKTPFQGLTGKIGETYQIMIGLRIQI